MATPPPDLPLPSTGSESASCLERPERRRRACPPHPPTHPPHRTARFRRRAVFPGPSFRLPLRISESCNIARARARRFLTRYSEIEGDTASRARWRASRAPRPSARRGFWACVPAWLSVLRAGTMLRKRVQSGNRSVFRDSSGGACFAMAAVAALERRKPPLPPERRRPRPQPRQI